MAFVPYKGATLLIPYDDVPHLFVVLNAPCKDGLCLLAMVTSIKENRYHDSACILKVGDHKFIKWDSYVLYRLATYAKSAHISNMVTKGLYIQREDVKTDVLERIIAGLWDSDNTTGATLKYAKSVGL